MHEAERQTRTMLMQKFEAGGFHPRTDLGQNFLIDLNLLGFIVHEAQLGPDDVVLEIGAGTGGMTAFLAEQAAAVVSVEIDHRIFGLAQDAVAGFSNVTLFNCDALANKNRFEPRVLEALQRELSKYPERRLKLVANLPYCIATPVISNLVASDLPWDLMIVTIQWELANRMRAQPKTSEYSALSVWLQAQSQVKQLKKLGPTVFWPRPGVDSSVVKITSDPARAAEIHDRDFFHDFVRRLFTQRRKHLRSVLVGMYRKQLEKSDVDVVLQPFSLKEGARAEELDVATLVKLSNAFRQAIPKEDSPMADDDTIPCSGD